MGASLSAKFALSKPSVGLLSAGLTLGTAVGLYLRLIINRRNKIQPTQRPTAENNS